MIRISPNDSPNGLSGYISIFIRKQCNRLSADTDFPASIIQIESADNLSCPTKPLSEAIECLLICLQKNA